MSTKRFIITRDYTLPNGNTGKQCWTGKAWSQEIEHAHVYHSIIEAIVVKHRLDFSTKRNLRLRKPGLKIMECDVRQILPEDLPGR